ncbi:hypothetical protein NDU88_005324 [Pleurodeles waltl]|uniref:Uncharacterized protein n=1 Tax=Pleurodeles waltl TaxID=8319 RepID=A0AAV7VIP6_PLEWA|nr:hypothetical protein NDU88_005324 [Pleurodeles waltl]
MVECPRCALMSIALLSRNVKKNQEVNVRAPMEAHAEKEDAEDQRKLNDRMETTGEASRQNKESLTLAEAEDDNDRAPLTQLTLECILALKQELYRPIQGQG